jgi:hypothetical protein
MVNALSATAADSGFQKLSNPMDFFQPETPAKHPNQFVPSQSQASAPDSSQDELFAKARAVPIQVTKLSESTLAILSDGDLVKPTFSPTSQKLAYSKVLVREDQALAELFVFHMNSKKSSRVLSEQQSKKYAVYGTFATSIRWADPIRVIANLSDGDVDGVELAIDSNTGKLISEKYIEAGLDEADIQRSKKLASTILQKFPSWRAEVLENALRDSSIFVGSRGIILQRNYSGYSNDIVLLDLESRKETVLIKMGWKDRYAMGGGFVVDGEAIFSVQTSGVVGIFKLTKQNILIPLGHIEMENSRQRAYVSTKYLSKVEAIFSLTFHSPSEHGDNPIFRYSTKAGLVRVSDFPEIYDFDVSKDRKWMAVSYWDSKERKIGIVRLFESTAP